MAAYQYPRGFTSLRVSHWCPKLLATCIWSPILLYELLHFTLPLDMLVLYAFCKPKKGAIDLLPAHTVVPQANAAAYLFEAQKEVIRMLVGHA
jgi:hypothetical protein